MNVFLRLKLGLFGKNKPSKFQEIFRNHISEPSIFSDAKETEDLCQKYGINYKKFAQWAQYEAELCENHFDKLMLSHIYDKYSISSAMKDMDRIISKLEESNAKKQKEIDDMLSKM